MLLLANAKSRSFRTRDGRSRHEVDAVFAGRESFWYSYRGNLVIYDFVFGIPYDERVTELDGNRLGESFSLQHDVRIFVRREFVRSDFGDLQYVGIRSINMERIG